MKANENIAIDYQRSVNTQNIHIQQEPSTVYLRIKYVIDFIVSLVGLVILAPVILIFSLLIVLESPGSPFSLKKDWGKTERTLKY